jgi:hypothetical protein
MPPAVIVALRHGEKPTSSSLHGLSPMGFARSVRYVTQLRPGVLLPPGAAEASEFLVPKYDGDPPTEGHRAYQTVAPVASVTGLVPTPGGKPGDVAGLLNAVLTATVATLVVCWEHDALVPWLTALAQKVTIKVAGGGSLPTTWPGSDFDTVWVLAAVAGAATPTYTLTIESSPAYPDI